MIVVVACSSLFSYAVNATPEHVNTGGVKYAVSYCLSLSYPDTVFSSDARYVAGAYLQGGNFGIDVYESIRAFVDEYRNTPYLSKHDKNLDIMRCVDLMGSDELYRLIGSLVNRSTNSGED